MNVTFSSPKTLLNIIVQIVATVFVTPVLADSSSPRLAAYYDLHLAICGDKVFEWSGDDVPRAVGSDIKQVGVGKSNRYALTADGKLLTWGNNHQDVIQLMENVGSFHAGRSGVFVISMDGNLWKISTRSLFGFGEALSEKPVLIASGILSAAIGDSANYYVTQQGALMVQGLAHRGQYGDGKLTATDDFVQTASDVVQVVAHTGHALILKNDGSVWGTGGNIYGPLGEHGYGDKAITWGRIMDEVNAIATGSSHSLSIRADRSLWIWGRHEGLVPRQIMSDVDAVAAGSRSSIAISKDALWQWHTGSKPRRIMDCL